MPKRSLRGAAPALALFLIAAVFHASVVRGSRIGGLVFVTTAAHTQPRMLKLACCARQQ